MLTRKEDEGQKSFKSQVLLLGHGLFAQSARPVDGCPAVWTVEVPLPTLIHWHGAELAALDTGQHRQQPDLVHPVLNVDGLP